MTARRTRQTFRCKCCGGDWRTLITIPRGFAGFPIAIYGWCDRCNVKECDGDGKANPCLSGRQPRKKDRP